jgi:hypothetical protein
MNMEFFWARLLFILSIASFILGITVFRKHFNKLLYLQFGLLIAGFLILFLYY